MSGPVEKAATVRTNVAERAANMERFATEALRLLLDSLAPA